ncbi:MAG: hypothetical protein JXQ96_11260 [Cyclobacteriaceae bacterium]
MKFIALNILSSRGIKVLIFLSVISCADESSLDATNSGDKSVDNIVSAVELPKRPGVRPETTKGVPHVQIDVELVSEVNKELYRRVFSIPGIENRPSVIAGWQGMWLSNKVNLNVPDAVIDGREFAHIHDDGSLHIFLEPSRSNEAVEKCWAIHHPFAIEKRTGWDGFVMLYTPQSIHELNVTFQLIVDGYNYVTGQNLLATDFY